MGREVRRVPPNWEHPTEVQYDPFRGVSKAVKQPMYDRTFAEAVAEWKGSFAKWEAGERESYFDASDYPDGIEFWEWDGGPPDRKYYRPWKDEEATWFQVWETVSEGTPVTPPFETEAELVDYLVANGDEWDQHRGDGGWAREAAEKFVGMGWAPSMMVINEPGRMEIREPRDGIPA